MNHINSTMLHIGKVAQYFFDNAVIEQVQDLTRVVHSPEKQAGPLVTKDRPWEHIPYFTCNTWNVIRDELGGEFKCWYEDWNVDPREVARTNNYSHQQMWYYYARSDDGLTWEKPELDYYEENGRKTNIVFGNPTSLCIHAATVLDDPLEADRERRFKMLFVHYPPDKPRRIEVAYSPNGIVWKTFKEKPQFGRLGPNLCDVLILTGDVEARIYRLTTRHPDMYNADFDDRRPRTSSFFAPSFPQDVGRTNKRRVFQSMSRDLIHWSQPQLILAPDDDEDNLDDGFYGMVPFRLGDLHVGLLNVIHQVSNRLDVRLVYSRDGWRWHHLSQRQPWLAPSPSDWDCCMVNVPNVPVPVGDELFVYYGGAKNHHDWWTEGLREGFGIPEALSMDEVSYGLGLAKLRKDGFVSIDAGPVREGILITRVLKTDGRNLVLNADCRNGGYIQVEVTDAQEQVLTGCARTQCDTFSGDNTQAMITWNGKADIAHNGHLRLRFFMRNASLYSFVFV